jgi:pimeloyl-ACP methyl ester carboxylesterase
MDLSHLKRFLVAVPDHSLDDLHQRLARTRWPNQADGPAWKYGADLAYLKHVQARWLNEYDWRSWEALLNKYGNYRLPVEGKNIYVMIERGSGRNPLPLVLLHGWPGSIVEFLHVIDPLAHPERHGGRSEDSFTVIVPSLPGFGFSDGINAPVPPGEIARRISVLIRDVLGVNRFVLQGGDWGAIIGSWLALDYPDGLIALHHNGPGLAGGHAPPPAEGEDALTPLELDWMKRNETHREGWFAYQQIQAQEPQTLAYGLTDSPIGLAAWIIQRFHAWTIRDSAEPPPFDIDHLLTNVMMYWLSGINIPNWLYISLVNGTARRVERGRKISVPAGFMFCPNDNIVAPPRRWIERVFADVRQRNDAQKGGHFFAFEQPDVFVSEVRQFFRSFR